MWQDSPFANARGSFLRPVTPPQVDPDSSPVQTVNVSCAWLPFIRGALMQLLLQSTWDTGNPAELLITQQRVFNLIDLFSECSGGSLPLSCPFDFTAAGADPSYFSNLFLASYDPSHLGVFDVTVGWESTLAGNTSGNNNRGIQIFRNLPTTVQIDKIAYEVVLDKGHDEGNPFEVDLFNGSTLVHSSVVTMASLENGFNLIEDTFTAVTVTQIQIGLVCGFQHLLDPGGHVTLLTFSYNIPTTGGCA